ncbi:glycosyltransferase family 2 protein [Pedobacter sp. MC2016-24]|uniref:glycosyltransferase family 2 protein n=1 Tax=Pedobacter sp. MC2016-24 TaxID=2780090 RepID=UPI001882A7D4|nr:glycosyltransferase family 2 protein [Pedobacter sp. MC2016-24]MBE9599519.1 glycosyltransferase family 2 protein [Pedobacter sp. MC2016-24]
MKDNKPFFSIVIPLYNKAHTIENTLNTVLAQKFTDFEVVLVDDGSTDDGVDLIYSVFRDQRIKVISQENQGVSAARNFGVKRSISRYIAFLDADDEWMPNYLTEMYSAIESFPNGGMFCSAGIVKNGDGTESLRIASNLQGSIGPIDFFQNPHVFLHTSATVVLKSEFWKTGGFPVGMKRNEDFALFFSLALITTVIYCGLPLSIYVGGVLGQATSISINSNLNHVVDRYNFVTENWLKLDCRNPTYKIFLKYELRHEIITYLRDNNYSSIELIMNGLDSRIKGLFSNFELQLYRDARFKSIATFFILLTKVRWRIRGFPVVGNK